MVDLSNCDKEPVATPGAIQPFGALAVISQADFKLSHWSTNLPEVLFSSVNGSDWRTLFDGASHALLEQAMAAGGSAAEPLTIRSANGKPFQAYVQHHGEHIFVEIGEIESDSTAELAEYHKRILSLASRFEDAISVQDVCARAVAPMRELTGYDRVMIYCFHPDMHGEVVAEDAAEGLESWLGLHYPASDIPEPARRIFLLNKLRVIPNVAYDAVPVVSATGGDVHALDLSRTLLRSVSPIHIEYLKNMQVKASLTVSLRHRDRLWGLIACHHYSGPKPASHALREACSIVGDYLAGAIRLQEENEAITRRLRWKAVEEKLVAQAGSGAQLGPALGQSETTVLELMSSETLGAAIFADARWTLVGRTPSPEALDELVSWIKSVEPGNLFVTDSLSLDYPPASEYAGIASGVMGISIPESGGIYILWFKPETVQTLTWGGNPEKPAAAGATIHPRKSFKSWTQAVQMKSLPWAAWERESAQAFRAAVTAAELRRQYLREREARAEAERSNRIKEDFVTVISHDLRDPLSSLTMNLLVLKKILTQPSQNVAQSVLRSMERASLQMQSLVTGLLDIAKAELGEVDLELSRTSATELVQECLDILGPLASGKGVQLAGQMPQTELFVQCDGKRVLQVLSNLIGNAVKFTPEGGSITVSLSETPESVGFAVADTGPGIESHHLPHIFDRYWRGATQGVRGVGLGLSIAKAVLDEHGSVLNVESVPGQGAIFSFALPRA